MYAYRLCLSSLLNFLYPGSIEPFLEVHPDAGDQEHETTDLNN